MRRVWHIASPLGSLALSCVCLASAPTLAADPVTLAIADFDYADTSGEMRDQSAEHATRLEDFARFVRDELSASGKYQVVSLSCPKPPCSAGAMDAETFIGAARDAGARLLLFGGIHKMSTLIQQGKAQVIDLERDKVVFDRMLSFRGDTDLAWHQASEFLAEQLISADLAR